MSDEQESGEGGRGGEEGFANDGPCLCSHIPVFPRVYILSFPPFSLALQAWAKSVSAQVATAEKASETPSDHEQVFSKLRSLAHQLDLESGDLSMARYKELLKEGKEAGETLAEQDAAAIAAGAGKMTSTVEFTVLRPAAYEAPTPTKFKLPYWRRPGFIPFKIHGDELVELSEGTRSEDVPLVPLASEPFYSKQMKAVAALTAKTAKGLKAVVDVVNQAAATKPAKAHADPGLAKLLAASNSEAVAAEAAKVVLAAETTAAAAAAKKATVLKPAALASKNVCPESCGTCKKGVYRSGELACASCVPTKGIKGKMEPRTLVNGDCKICTASFCAICGTRPKLGAKKGGDQEELVCAKCSKGLSLVDGKCVACELDSCAACGVRAANFSEKKKNAKVQEALTCTKCTDGSFLVNGECKQCDSTKCGSCTVRKAKSTKGRRLLAAPPAKKPVAATPRILPSGDGVVPDEMVCASCQKPKTFPDGGKGSKLYLVDGACIKCGFPQCRDCVSDGKRLHCVKCAAPFLPLGSYRPMFAQSGLNVATQAQCQKCKPNCLECAHAPHWCTKCDTSIGLAMQVMGFAPKLNATVATCKPVHKSCKTSNVPAGPGPGASYSCTSCYTGFGIHPLFRGASQGRCVPCHASCGNCHEGGNAASCTVCKGGKKLTVLDSAHYAGQCGLPAGLIKRNNGCKSGSTFVPVALGKAAKEDHGLCKELSFDCSAICVPGDDTTAAPGRRVCSKACHQKVYKKNKAGKRSIIVCAMAKSADCKSLAKVTPVAAKPARRLLAAPKVPSEKCTSQMSSQCVAAVPFTEAANTLSPCTLIDEQKRILTALAAAGKNATVGCATVGAEVCESALLMF